jgi:hypothetical protein
MTVRVTTLKGLEAGRYYTERLPGYYLNGRECLKNGVSACWPDMLTQFLGWQKGNRR